MKWLLRVVSLLALTACAAACSAADRPDPLTTHTAAETRGANHVRVPREDMYIQVSALGGLDYFQNHKLGMKLAGKALGVYTDYVGPEGSDLEAMKESFRQAIRRKPAGIVVVGFDKSLNPLVDLAVDEGIPVVTVDSDLPESKRVAFVGTGNHQAGYEGGLKLAELMGGTGKAVVMSIPGQPNLDERVKGYMEALRSYPGIEMVGIVDVKSGPEAGARELAAIMEEQPDLSGVGCVEATGGTAAVQAISGSGLEGRIQVVAMDSSPDVISGIQDGIISASVVQQTALMPFYAVQILYNLNHGPIIPDLVNNQQQLGTPMMIDTGVVIIDKSNYKQILQE